MPSVFARYDPTYVWEEPECTASCHIYYSLGLGFQIEERTANTRPDALDWGYELVTRATS